LTILYLDTNPFIDFIKQRTNEYGDDISNSAGQLFLDTLSCKYNIAVSTWALKQIYDNIRIEEINMLFIMLKKKIIKISYDEEDIKKAKDKSLDNFEDAMHIVLAEKIKADIIITRNVDHFKEIGTDILIKKPEWI